MFMNFLKKVMNKMTERTDVKYKIPNIPEGAVKEKSIEEYKEFIDYYGGIDFTKISFRPGASFSCPFGLTRRYKIFKDDKGNRETVWGYPGIHSGVDRAGANHKKYGKDPVVCPFNFGSSGYEDLKGKYTGTNVLFFHRFGFRIKIGHMFPDEIKIKDKLMAGYAIGQNTFIGPAGEYGFSFGEHTHTEIESWGYNGEWLETCYLLDLILDQKFKEKARAPISNEEIIEIYRGCEFTKNWKPEQIFNDYNEIIKTKNIIFLNKYKIVYKYKNKISTKYDTQSLFNM